MNERRRPPRRGRGPRSSASPVIEQGEPNPYREAPTESGDTPIERAPQTELAVPAAPPPPSAEPTPPSGESAPPPPPVASAPTVPGATPAPRADGAYAPNNGPREGGFQERQNGRRGRRNRGRGRRDQAQGPGPGNDRPQGNPAPTQLVATGETTGWFDPSRDGGFVRRSQASYLADAGDAYVSPFLVRQYGLRKSDEIAGTTGRDPRGRSALIDITSINGLAPTEAMRRPE